MRYEHKPGPATRAKRRKENYLSHWPVHAQLEALFEDRDGRPEKLDAMRADFARIKREHPVD